MKEAKGEYGLWLWAMDGHLGQQHSIRIGNFSLPAISTVTFEHMMPLSQYPP
jgi:hypothetical protein